VYRVVYANDVVSRDVIAHTRTLIFTARVVGRSVSDKKQAITLGTSANMPTS